MKIETRSSQGFTIIEVLIVLAIAALIMLIVFLAVPALQRNSRNNARNNDASRIAVSARECLVNNQYPSPPQTTCNVAAIDPGNLSQLDYTVQAFSTGSTTTANVLFNFRCNGNSWTSSSRSIAVIFRAETANGDTPRCING